MASIDDISLPDTTLTHLIERNEQQSTVHPRIQTRNGMPPTRESRFSDVPTKNSRDAFKQAYPILDKCLTFHAIDPRSVSNLYTVFVVIALVACFVFTFPPAERIIIYVSDTIYIVEWALVRQYLNSSTHFFDRAMVTFENQKSKPSERLIILSIIITLAIVTFEKLVWFLNFASQPSSLSWWLEVFGSITFVWRLHSLFVVATILQMVIASHTCELQNYCGRMIDSSLRFTSEADRALALKEHAGLSSSIIQTSNLISATMGSSIAISLLSVILISWYMVAGAAPYSLLLAVFDYFINYMLCLSCLVMGAGLSSDCKEPYKIMLRLVAQSDEEVVSPQTNSPKKFNDEAEAQLLPDPNESIALLQYFKLHSDGLKIYGILLTKNEIGRALYLFVTIIAVVLLQLAPLS